MSGDNSHNELRRILELDESELVREIGNEIARSKKHALPPSASDAKRLTENWWQDNLSTLQKAICGNASIKQISCDPTLNFQLAIEILSLLTGATLPVSPLKACGLVIKRGLVVVCGEGWQNK